MNEIPNRKSLTTNGWSNWSPAQKGGLIGATVGAVVTIGFYIYAANCPIRFPSFGFLVTIVLAGPTNAIWHALGLSDSEAAGKLKHLAFLLVVVTNTLEGFLLGTAVGWSRRSSNKD